MFAFQTVLRPDRLRLCDLSVFQLQTTKVRYVSLNSAIRRGRENGPERGKRDRNGKPKRDTPSDRRGEYAAWKPNRGRPSNDGWNRTSKQNSGGSAREDGRPYAKRGGHGRNVAPKVDNGSWVKEAGRHSARESDYGYASMSEKARAAAGYDFKPQYEPSNKKAGGKILFNPPYRMPYSSPTSEFVYGASAVQAAVRCGRRKLHVLYIYDVGENVPMEKTRWESPLGRSLSKLMLHRGGVVKRVRGKWLQLLDRVSDGRPHNGFLLDASPLPKLPAKSYQRVESPAATEFMVDVERQPKEEAEVNGTDGSIQLAPYRVGAVNDPSTELQRYPFTLLLDGILDPGNLGAIIRSAHYLGVDAIAFSARNSAPLSPVTIKASAGAAESIPLISVNDPSSFIKQSRHNGWRFFAAMAPASAASSDKDNSDALQSTLTPSELSSQLRESPCVLMLGGEGAGLSRKLSNAADSFVAVPGVFTAKKEEDDAGVDSLNVSVATALLSEAFLREYSDTQTRRARLEAETEATQQRYDKDEDSLF